MTHPLPHAVPELARSEHLDVRHPGENPARQFLATGGLQAELQRAVPTLPQCLAPVPDPLSDVGGDLAGEEQAHLPGFVGLADAEGVFEEGGRVEASRAGKVLTGASEGAAAGQGKSLNVGRRRVQRQQVPVAVIGHQVIGLQQVVSDVAVESLVAQAQPLPLVDGASGRLPHARLDSGVVFGEHRQLVGE